MITVAQEITIGKPGRQRTPGPNNRTLRRTSFRTYFRRSSIQPQVDLDKVGLAAVVQDRARLKGQRRVRGVSRERRVFQDDVSDTSAHGANLLHNTEMPYLGAKEGSVNIMSVRSMLKARILGVVAGAALLAVTVMATPASAAPGGGSAAGLKGNCVVNLARGSTSQTAPTCFSTFTQSVSYATGGAVTDAPARSTRSTGPAIAAEIESANAVAVSRDAAQPNAALASVVIGIEYDLANFSTASWSLIFTGTGPCTLTTTDIDFVYDLPPVYWDQISSFQNFNVCDTDHYLGQGFTGLHTGFFPSQATMPFIRVVNVFVASDNATRSLTWS